MITWIYFGKHFCIIFAAQYLSFSHKAFYKCFILNFFKINLNVFYFITFTQTFKNKQKKFLARKLFYSNRDCRGGGEGVSERLWINKMKIISSFSPKKTNNNNK